MRKNVPFQTSFSFCLKSISHALAFCLTFFSAFVSFGQAQMIKDVNPKESPYPQEYSEVINDGNGNVYFISRGKELWITKTSISPQSAVMIKSMRSISNLTVAGSNVFFIGEDGAGKELWKTNGSGSTTRKVKEIRSGSKGSDPTFLTNINGTLYFAANNGVHGNELWKSNGTDTGTVMVKDFNPGSANGDPGWMTEMNGMIYLAATGASKGSELWRTNGTSSGSQMVADLYIGAGSSSPAHLAVVNNQLFFTATDAYRGRELFISGTNGTGIFYDINPGPASSDISNMTALGNTCYFSANDGTNGVQLWRTKNNLTTTRVSSFAEYCEEDENSEYYDPDCPRLTLRDFKVIAHGLYFVRSTSNNADMHRVDEFDETLRQTFNLNYDGYNPRYTAMGDGIYFFNFNWTDFKPDDPTNEEQQALQLYKMTLQGTDPQWIRNFHHEYTFDGGDKPRPEMTAVNGQLYFPGILNDNEGYKMLRSPGTSEAYIVKDTYFATLSSHPRNFITVNGITFFTTGGFDYETAVWRTDKTSNGTFLIKEFNSVLGMVQSGNYVYILADRSYEIDELWRTDGTLAGTVLLKSFTGNQFGHSYSKMLDAYGTLYFSSEAGTLWKSNGTAASTIALKDFGQINYLGKGGGRLIFSATVEGRHELWRSSGTSNSTAKLKTIHPSPHYVSPNSERITANNMFYFVSWNPTHGSELWRSDGTTSGTYLLKDIRQDDLMRYEDFVLTEFRDSLYFITETSDYRYTLFKSNGTTTGTVAVTEVPPTRHMASGGDYLSMFVHSEGLDLWTSKGTASTTEFIKTVDPLVFFYDPSFSVVDGVTYFSWERAENLWRTDGTECGTFPLDTPDQPYGLALNGTDLIFGAHTETYGREPYKISLLVVPGNPCSEENTFAQSSAIETKSVEYGPNPFTDKISLKINGALTDNVSITVKSFTGDLIYHSENANTSTDFDLGENWPKGLYIVDVVINGKTESFRVVKK